MGLLRVAARAPVPLCHLLAVAGPAWLAHGLKMKAPHSRCYHPRLQLVKFKSCLRHLGSDSPPALIYITMESIARMPVTVLIG